MCVKKYQNKTEQKKERWSNDNVVYYCSYLAVNKRYSNFDCSRDVVRKRFLAPSLVLLERVATGILVSFKGLIQVF